MTEPPLKRARDDDAVHHHQQQVVTYTAAAASVGGMTNDTSSSVRTSSLPSPTMKLTGHKGSVYACQFDPQGDCLVSASFDMTCLLWNAASSTYENYNVLTGHKNAILDVQFNSHGDYIVTASADKTLGWYEAATGVRIKKLQGHTAIVNAVDTTHTIMAPTLLVSASDDATARLWDIRQRGPTATLTHDYALTSVAYDGDNHLIYTGGIDNHVHVWDVRNTQTRTMTMKGHADTITSLSLHPKKTHLLSHSMDGTLKSWDVRPFAKQKRLDKTFVGSKHNAEKGLLKCAWSSDGSMVTGGSADRMVHIWDELTTEELYLLPGHKGCVNTVIFHPTQNIIASGSSDNSIYVGELGQ